MIRTPGQGDKEWKEREDIMDYIKELVKIVGEKNVKTDQIERLCHSRDMSVTRPFRTLSSLS